MMFLSGLALKSTAVLACAWLISTLLRRRSAALRHLVWTAAAVAVLVLPFLSVSLPVLRVPVAAALSAPVLFESNVSARTTAEANPGHSIAAAATFQAAPAVRIDWSMIALTIWAAGALLALARMISAWVSIERLRLRARPFFDTGLSGALARTLQVRKHVDVLETTTGSMPMTFGIWRPAILMPAEACGWSQERTRVVLLHELAHVRRGDVATHLLARLALIAYWWNPLAWLAWREFVKEGERAADDLVLNAGTAAGDYAGHLFDVAKGMQLAPMTGWAAVAMIRRSQLETRLQAILDADIKRTGVGRTAAVVTALLALALIAPLAAVRAQDTAPAGVPADLDATIRAAHSQKNYEILDSAAKAASEARQYDVAEKLLDADLAIRGEVAGSSSREYGLGLLSLAALQQRRHENDSAAASFAMAAQILGEDPHAATALLYLGTAALIKKNYAQATEYFQHAERIDPASAGMALMWSAIAMESQKNNEEANALFRRAVAQQDPGSPAAPVIYRVYSRSLKTQGQYSEAADIDARVDTWFKDNARQSTRSELPAGVYRIGGAVKAPKLLEKVEPEYSEVARAAKISGTEILSVQIGPDGLAHKIRVVRGLGLGLDENGVDAVSQWRFEPGTKDGQPVTVLATIEINFRLL
jgi:TonB family protein